MISIVIPTRNRAHTLAQVLDSFYQQKHVSEIVFVDDESTDETAKIIESFQSHYPQVKTVYLKNDQRKGAAYSRLRGLNAISNEYILFGDDDDFLESNYTEICLQKLNDLQADIVSGRHFYRTPGESVDEAIARFANGENECPVFNSWSFKLNLEARLHMDIELPFTHAIYLAKKEKLLQLGIDPFYAKGNGMREESDIQANIFSRGGKIVMTNDTHSVHMHPSEVKSGGQRVGRLSRFYWSVYYTFYFMRKYQKSIFARLGIRRPLWLSLLGYLAVETYHFFIRPFVLVWDLKRYR